ncbi:MAG: transglutaminase-like domain-containing protein [Planctomycetota bacterium]
MIASLGCMLAHGLLSMVASTSTPLPAVVDEASPAPKIAETRTYRIRQTVMLADVPETAKEVRLWVPIPADGTWQHVLDRRVVEAPEGWSLVHQAECDADMVVVTTKGGGSPKVVVETTVLRESPKYDLAAYAGQELQSKLFYSETKPDAPLMTADARVSELAAKACAGEKNLSRKVVKLLDAVANVADHYSKDATKPSCGRGAAEDCLENGGGCCTDLHSLFIAAARQQGIPARMQYGYRLKADKEDTEYDPSYRCWVEFFLPGSGWVPTDIVVADAGEPAARAANYGTLDARRVWLWHGRGLELTPKQRSAPIQTMSCGWAEIDGEAVDVLPSKDGKPSKLTRTILFQELTPKVASAK